MQLNIFGKHTILSILSMLTTCTHPFCRQAGSAFLSPSCICQDPVLPCGCPGVDPGVSVIGASVSPADHTSDHIAAILHEDKRTSRVSLTRVLAGVSSADCSCLQCCCHRLA